MDASPIGYLLLFALLLVGGAYFAGTEIALASVNRIRIIGRADHGDKRAENILYILDHFDMALSTLLIGNNVMHIGCASIAALTATKLWGAGAIGPATIVTTIIVFLIAEMLPKAFAKACSERFALATAGSLIKLMHALAPISRVFAALGNFIKRPFERHVKEDPTVSEDELHDIIESISEEGELDEDTSELVQSALEFTDTKAREVVTPWSEARTLRLDMTPPEVLDVIRATHYSRFPVVDSSGTPVGMLNMRAYLKAYAATGGKVAISEEMDEAHYVPAGRPIDELLHSMSAAKIHMALVRGESGAVTGIVTVEDILEELVGEIYDEEDEGSGEQ